MTSRERGAGEEGKRSSARAPQRPLAADLEPYAEAWRERFAAAEDARLARAAAARERLPEIVRRLAGHGGRRVWVFGSLVDGGFHEHSDIDLAVEGLPRGAALFRIAVELDGIAAPFEIDLVPIEDARDPLVRRILERGELLHGTGQA